MYVFEGVHVVSDNQIRRELYNEVLSVLRKKDMKRYISKVVRGRLSKMPEYSNVKETAEKCKAVITENIDKQLFSPGSNKNYLRFGNEKVEKYRIDKGYAKKYVKEAVNSYCRSKIKKCGAAENKSESLFKGYDETIRKKSGVALRVDNAGQDTVFDSSSQIYGLFSELSNEAKEEMEVLFRRLRFKDRDIECFWDKCDGLTYSEMAKKHQGSCSQKHSDSLYSKRFNRLRKKLEPHKDKLMNIVKLHAGY